VYGLFPHLLFLGQFEVHALLLFFSSPALSNNPRPVRQTASDIK
jgi:hypothetical protein